MNLSEMINGGAEALHRGSVDHIGSGNSTPCSPQLPRSSQDESSKQTEKAPEVPAAPSVRKPRSKKKRRPNYSNVFKGKENRVNDENRMRLAQTRPELAEVFSARDYDPSQDDSTDHLSANTGAPAFAPADEGLESPKGSLVPPKLSSTPFTNLRFPPVSVSEIGPGGNLSLTGLCASIAGLIPNEDQTQLLAGWLFSKLTELENRGTAIDNVEIEFKLGRIVDMETEMRHKFSHMSEAVLDPAWWKNSSVKFNVEVDSQSFKAMESTLDRLAQANAANEGNVISRRDTLMRDDMYKVDYTTPNDHHITKARVSTDDRGNLLQCISKQRIGDLFISMPNSAYDLKMSLNIEHPVDIAAIKPSLVPDNVTYTRHKNRLSWNTEGCHIDLTSVRPPRGSTIKEAEIEVNTKMLASIMHEYHSSRDQATSLDKFLELIRYTMDSARFVVRNA